MKMEIPVKFNDVQGLYNLATELSERNSFFTNSAFAGKRVTLPRVICEDGFSVSCQAGFVYYSIPREDGCVSYDAWELGYPSQADDLIEQYKEDATADSTKTVYPFVPTDAVNQLIQKHGGIVAVGYLY